MQVFSGGLFGTFLVNAIGSFVLALLVFHPAGLVPELWRLPVTLGLLGGFTTFSTYSVDLLRSYHDSPMLALAYFFGTNCICLLLALLGWRCVS